MDRGQLAACGRFASLDIDHVVSQTKHLLAQLENAAADFDNVAGEKFALVADVLLDPRHAAAALAEMGRRHAGLGEQVPGGFVELTDVPHHVHMAHVIAVPRIDRATIGQYIRHYASPSICEPRSRPVLLCTAIIFAARTWARAGTNRRMGEG